MIGSRLKQARLLAGMKQIELASQLNEAGYKITAAAVSKYENDKSYPPAQFMLLASKILDVPSSYFIYQRARSMKWIGFRCRQRLGETARKRIKAYASDVAELQAELRDLLYPENKPSLPCIPVANLDDAESAAEQLRKEWDVGNRPLDNLVQTAEDREVIVIGWNDEKDLFDGLSGRCDDRPVTVINTHFPLDRRRLTLAHEIGHLVMDRSPDADQDEESLAFRFAAALLVPAEHAYRELGASRNLLNWGELKSLKRKYGLSMSAWVRRAYDLEIINHSVYKALNIDLRKRDWHKAEPIQYVGDEEPLQLNQMMRRAMAEGLVAPDRFAHLDVNNSEPDEDMMPRGEFPSAIELMEMDVNTRENWIVQMFQWAEGTEFEVFAAYGEEEL